jgi:toxin-antitoxin system PIN domain toxin
VFVLDTNVLVYAADADAREHAPCRALLERCRTRNDAWYLTWNVCYEFLRVVTHPRAFRNPWTATDANAFLRALQSSPSLSMLLPTDRHDRVLADLVRELPFLSGNLVHDAHTAVLMREHGLRRIYTRDTDFHRFPFLEPVDPLAIES